MSNENQDDLRERLAEEIAQDLAKRFSLSVLEALPIDKGFLNVKWKLETNRGPLFLKFYHPNRYSLQFHPDRRAGIDRTLKFQQGLHEAGVPCSAIYTSQGQHLLSTAKGSYYTLQNWIDGYTVKAGCMNEEQMYSLGKATGRMHQWLETAAPLEEQAWKPDPDAYFDEWRTNKEKAQEASDETVLEWLQRSEKIVNSLDFRQFDSSPVGWLHWDLWVDNLVLQTRGVAGIVDFDRMAVAYPEIDLARCVLSGALKNGQLQLANVHSFMAGYGEHRFISPDILARAFRLIYLIESIWWLRTEVREQSELRESLARFVEEMHWIEDQWESLPELFQLK
ncbi:phosphotransferase enzyme family protein [Paenibacillus sp. GCM10027627]|uniref:phosphotransferase enzyme family protein n=1 Tax=unclassified Paenibacillus TaxID=185978 RepID=UPI00363430DD